MEVSYLYVCLVKDISVHRVDFAYLIYEGHVVTKHSADLLAISGCGCGPVGHKLQLKFCVQVKARRENEKKVTGMFVICLLFISASIDDQASGRPFFWLVMSRKSCTARVYKSNTKQIRLFIYL